MPSLRPTSSFEHPAAISSTTCRWRSVIGGAVMCVTSFMPPTLTAVRASSHPPNGVIATVTPRELAAYGLVERRGHASERLRRRRGIAYDDGDLLQLPS